MLPSHFMNRMLQGIGNNSGVGTNLLLQRYQRLNTLRVNQSLARLASGQRINSAADDPAGLIASEQLRASIAALEAESQQLQRTDVQAAVAGGALAHVSDLLNQANSLVVANASDGLSAAEKDANQIQIDSILSSVDHIARSTSFNGSPLLDGTAKLRVTNQTLEVTSTRSENLGSTNVNGASYSLADLKSGGSLQTSSGSTELAHKVLSAAQSQVNRLRGKIGAFQSNTIRSRQNSIGAAIVNLSAAESQIRDVDYAAETSQKVRYELLKQTSSLLLVPRNSARGRSIDIRA